MTAIEPGSGDGGDKELAALWSQRFPDKEVHWYPCQSSPEISLGIRCGGYHGEKTRTSMLEFEVLIGEFSTID